MKIIPPNPSPETTPRKAVGKTPLSGEGPSFGQVLNQAVDGQSAQVSQTPTAMQINRPEIVSTASASTPQASAAQLETTLDAFDTYRRALADPHTTSLRDVEPLLSTLEAQRQTMDAALEKLPSDDPLRQIGNEMSAAIQAEQGRFRQGLYN